MNHGLFQAGRPVIGDKLIGREEILDKIIHFLTTGQSIVLIAPRRFGKTSILLEALTRIKKMDSFTAFVDIFAVASQGSLAEQITASVLSNKKLDKTFGELRKNLVSILKKVEFKQVIEDFEYILGFAEKSRDELSLLASSIDFIDQFAAKNKKQITCGFDEFGDIEKLDGNQIVKLFRSKIQLQQNATYIFSGSHQSVMEQIFITSKSPFYRFARVIEVNEIEPGIFKDFIAKAFDQKGITIGQPALDRILQFTNGHPYYTQLVCRELEYLALRTGTIDEEKITEAIEEAYWSEINYIEKSWEELSASREQTQVAIAISENIESLYAHFNKKNINVGRALRKMMKAGILKKSGKNYRIIDPMLRYFICKEILKWDRNDCLGNAEKEGIM